MNAEDLGRNYDKIADWWEGNHKDSSYGVNYVVRAIQKSKTRNKALDVGCGSGGRIIDTILAAGYDLTGIDVSSGMTEIAKSKQPEVTFINADFMTWHSDEEFDLIIAWDSIFHAPRSLQKSVIEKLCLHLAPDGILLFTCGGFDGEVSGEMKGVPFEYGSLSYLEYLEIVKNSDCETVTMERDQPKHMVFICRKNKYG